MERTRSERAEGGFTLIESMIAMFFLAYIVSQMGLVMLYASRTTNLSQRVARANALAEEAVEKTRNTAYNSLQIANAALGESCTVSGTVATCTSVLDGSRFTRVRTVSPLPAGTALLSSNQSGVDVSVSFTDGRGNPQVIRVASIVSRYY